MLLSVLLFPIISMILCGFFGFFLGPTGVRIISLICLSFTFFYSVLLFILYSLLGNLILLPLTLWINLGQFYLEWCLLYDSVTSIMFLVVTFISLLVHSYSFDYMENDPHFPRFIAYLSLFTFFMLILVSADNFLQLFIGWEGVGLCSYLLISFWYTRIQANKAAIKALVVNRIGDFALILGICLIFLMYQTIKYSIVFSVTPLIYNKIFFSFFNFDCFMITGICFFLFIGAVGKSAQIGLHTWLPDAMEGPTPVSALIHAATMVTAGVFLIIRCSPLFEYAPKILLIVAFIGGLTAFFAATIGLVQHDIKKIIAYSTCSQLGYMIFACGLSNYTLSLYHLTTHACFKALLFLCAGSIIHAICDEQDIRKMGGLRILLPYTYISMLIGSFALIGFPFLAGYYSKDMILESTSGNIIIISTFIYWLASIAAICTMIYSTRLLFLTFFCSPNGYKTIYTKIHEAPLFITIVLGVLSVASIFCGFCFQEIFCGMGTFFFGQSIYVLPQNLQLIELEFLPWYIKIIPILYSVIGFCIIFSFYIHEQYYPFLLKIKLMNFSLYTFLLKKWYFDLLYNNYFVLTLFNMSYSCVYFIIDKGVLELFGPFGLKQSCFNIARNISHLHTGVFYHYFCIMFFSFFIFVLLLI
jgi:proton-translocating NADH-quinone oxidoreductase chain L